jgi:hypothetical protein
MKDSQRVEFTINTEQVYRGTIIDVGENIGTNGFEISELLKSSPGSANAGDWVQSTWQGVCAMASDSGHH